MTEYRQVYECNICGNIVEVIHPGKGQLVCCGQPMKLLKEKSVEKGKEKHVPIVEVVGEEVKIKVGSIPHPMEENHYIEWVEVITNNSTYRRFLKPGEEPSVEFKVDGKVVLVRAYCNVHGLWRSS